MRVIIMAGGRGTRIAESFPDIPKPMIPIGGKPVLEHQLVCLRKQGFDRVEIVTGYLGHYISDYFQDGSQFGLTIQYHHETQPLGTAGVLLSSALGLKEEFILLNGDIIFELDMGRLLNAHKASSADATLVAHPNNHPHDSTLLFVNAENRVTKILFKEDERPVCKNLVNAGIHVLSPSVIPPHAFGKKLDLDREVLSPATSTHRVFAYITPEYVHDMGTKDRYDRVEADILAGKVDARNLQRKQKAIFLDRDGVINVNKPYIAKCEDFHLLNGVTQAIAAVNDSGYLVIVVTNQPVVARGACSEEDLYHIHCYMESLLGAEGAFIDALYYCPHHPEAGFEGERVEYKIQCECRKPNPGMILKAAQDYNIDLRSSYFVGDNATDVSAAIASGVTPVLIGDKCKDADVVNCSSLSEFVFSILKRSVDI